jgi:hypothetical protein
VSSDLERKSFPIRTDLWGECLMQDSASERPMLRVPCIGIELSLRFAHHDCGHDLNCQFAASELGDDLRRVDLITIAPRIGQAVIKIPKNRARLPASI